MFGAWIFLIQTNPLPTMKRCWLHVGMHKTGSTSVQVTLSSAGRIPGWRYLLAGRRANLGQSLYAMLAADAREFHTFVKKGASDAEVKREGEWLRRALEREIRGCREENLILSAEALSIIDRPGIASLREFLSPLCDEVRVIGYVRPPLAFKVSHFQQRVKHGLGTFDVARIRPRYRKRFRKFDKEFGRENVILRKFDPALFPGQCVVRDFCAQVGLPFPADRPVVRSNESLSREACGILYAYRKYGPGFGVGPEVIRENQRLIAALVAMGGTKFRVCGELLAAGLAEDAEDVRWMEERLQCPLDERIPADAEAITCEEDLLEISGASCEAYAARMRAIYGIKVPRGLLPEGGRVDPRRVAAMVEYFRERIRRRRRFLPLLSLRNRLLKAALPSGRTSGA